MTTPKLSDVLNELHGYERVAFRIALRSDPQGGWRLHTLVVDAIPEAYTRDAASFQLRYNSVQFVHTYSTAVFIAGVQESSKVTPWFDVAQDFSIPVPNGPSTSTGVFTTRMIALQEQPLSQPYYYRTALIDGFDRMSWPHTLYNFSPSPFVPEQYDNTRLVPTAGSGSRMFSDFKRALIDLVFGLKDPDRTQGRDTSPGVHIRIVHETPFFAEIRQIDNRHVSVVVQGLQLSGAVVQFDATPAAFIEKPIRPQSVYQFELEIDLPRSGHISLIRGNEMLDTCEWDNTFAPLPGAPSSNMKRPPAPFSLLMLSNPSERRILENLGEISGVSAETPDDPAEDVPPAIRDSLAKFRADHSDGQKVGFIMMRFAKTKAHSAIVKAIKEILNAHGLKGVRADDKQYHENTYENIQTYMHGCGFGIAVFERLESDQFNPNVAFEVGYMKAMDKPVCLLKDTTLTALHTDLLGKLYRPFDAQRIHKSMKPELENWLRDNELLPDQE